MPLALIISIGSAVVSGISYIAKTIIEWLKRKAEALPFYSATLVINTSMLALFSTYVYAIIKLITFTYGVINDFIAFLSNLGGSGEVTDLIQKMLSTAMFYQALHDVFVIFSPVLTSIFLIISYKVGYKVLYTARESLLSLVISKLT